MKDFDMKDAYKLVLALCIGLSIVIAIIGAVAYDILEIRNKTNNNYKIGNDMNIGLKLLHIVCDGHCDDARVKCTVDIELSYAQHREIVRLPRCVDQSLLLPQDVTNIARAISSLGVSRVDEIEYKNIISCAFVGNCND